MLTQIEVSNFRVFDRPVTVRVRPVTVIIGRNSSGKSSLIKLLLMLQQSLRTDTPSFLVSDGPRVRLGRFADLKNSLSSENSLRFALHFETRDIPDESKRAVINAMKKAKLKSDPFTGDTNLGVQVKATANGHRQREETATIDVQGQVSYRQQAGTHEVVVRMNDEVMHRDFARTRAEGVRFLHFPPRSTEATEGIVRAFADQYLDPARYEIREMRHLGPVRLVERNGPVTAAPPDGDVGQYGEFAIPHFQTLLRNGGESAKFARRHLEAVADVVRVRFRSQAKGLTTDAKAVNKTTGAECYLGNFGFGVSQSLPVIVQGAILPAGHLLMVEQPEAQLHPTAQLELGQFFAELWTQRKVPSLIETHSSNILLRLKLLVARSELPADAISVAYVHADKDGRPIVTNLEMDSRGRLEKGLPLEFFGADIRESLKFR